MIKLNKKGFMMAEVIVVSSIVLITLTSLYMSYNKIYSAYKKRINYYDVSIIYDLDKIRDYSERYISSYDEVEKISDENIKEIFNINDIISVYSIPLDNNKIALSDINQNDMDVLFHEYIGYLSKTLKLKKSYSNILVMEKCDKDKKNCKYGYLEGSQIEK